MKKICMYLLDTMADWEHGYLLQGLTLQGMRPRQDYQFCTAALEQRPIRTAGGMTLTPDLRISQLDEEDIAALILIGADTWLEDAQGAVLDLAERLLERGGVVAGICGATLGLADRGLLDSRPHTSNGKFFLKGLAKGYRGAEYYRDEGAVRAGNLITAGSAGSLLWARLILEALDLYPAAAVEAWFQYFSTGDPRFFQELTQALQG